MRMIAAFRKDEALRFIGHLDLMRAIQRALRRSGLPLQYSNGFNPHIRLSFAAPLSVGVIGLNEMMEVPLTEEVAPGEFIARMNGVLPHCLRITACMPMDEKAPSLMALVAGADYRLELPACPETEKLCAAFEGFMALDAYVALRKTKSGENMCDIRPYVISGDLWKTEGGAVITLRTKADAGGMLKSTLWLKCLCDYAGVLVPEGVKYYRVSILTKAPDGTLSPMEEASWLTH